MIKSGFDLILGSKTHKVLGIVLTFGKKEIILDEISLPMRDMSKLTTQTQIEKSWTVNSNIY